MIFIKSLRLRRSRVCMQGSVAHRFTVVAAILVVSLTQALAQQNAPSTAPMTPSQKAEMAKRVRQEFLHAWNGYRKYAWGHDALKPLSHQPVD